MFCNHSFIVRRPYSIFLTSLTAMLITLGLWFNRKIVSSTVLNLTLLCQNNLIFSHYLLQGNNRKKYFYQEINFALFSWKLFCFTRDTMYYIKMVKSQVLEKAAKYLWIPCIKQTKNLTRFAISRPDRRLVWT